MELICPICAQSLRREEKRLVCPNRHSFDIARQGYVNLLAVQQKHSLSPGDTREQVLSRRAFLEAGFYSPISEELNRAALAHNAQGEILDIGCGEGYYSARLAQAIGAPLTGLDISKEAVRCAAGKYKEHSWLCATAAHIPTISKAARTRTASFTARDITMFALTVRTVLRASRFAFARAVISPPISTTSAASMAAPLPRAPIATPTSARAREGESFMPSPAYITQPSAQSSSIFSNFSSGISEAYTVSIPTSDATFPAADSLSPVSMTVFATPCSLSSLSAGAALGFTVSER